jgi:nitroreductase
MELLKALSWRYATKRMNGQRVPDEKVNTILEAIRLSASSLGLQPYRVIVVDDADLKAKIHEKACQQPQIVEGSHVLVFAAYKNINEDMVNDYITRIANERGVEVSQLGDFKQMINGFLSSKSVQDIVAWNTRQAYIGLGHGLVAAAIQEVDATPMEGFDPNEMDNVLGLGELGLQSVVVLTIGYRDPEKDYLANAQKVRLPMDTFFIRK